MEKHPDGVLVIDRDSIVSPPLFAAYVIKTLVDTCMYSCVRFPAAESPAGFDTVNSPNLLS
jgi:hypothetical protein